MGPTYYIVCAQDIERWYFTFDESEGWNFWTSLVMARLVLAILVYAFRFRTMVYLFSLLLVAHLPAILGLLLFQQRLVEPHELLTTPAGTIALTTVCGVLCVGLAVLCYRPLAEDATLFGYSLRVPYRFVRFFYERME